ncbi:MAG: tRNA (adenosine(37)-N6)-dimethylallyltransferase MiaA [Hahellaceae bacterium]|nr:tRNA (adenosine(37)-N6)-dimethylallyltransferase MiaA [Hahellaceae bacterium]
MGPTAAGKTALAMALADAMPCDLISVDSVLVYREMDIGSAKPDRETLARYPHQLIDIRDPAEAYSAAEFREDALKAIQTAVGRGRLPVLVGGTSMYFKALCQGIGDLPSADPAIRRRLEEEALQFGWGALHQRLQSLDPLAGERIHPANRQRIQRALEVIELSGRPISSFWQSGEGGDGEVDWDRPATADLPFRPLAFAVDPGERQVLHHRIAARFREMLDQGLIEEVRRLHERGDLSPELPSIRAVGYRQVWEYLEGKYDRAMLFEKGCAATRQLARRQLTWLRSWPEVTWISGGDKVSEGVLQLREHIVSIANK